MISMIFTEYDFRVYIVSYSQCAAAVFNLDQKFQKPNYFFSFLWCKTSLKELKNLSVNKVPSKIISL